MSPEHIQLIGAIAGSATAVSIFIYNFGRKVGTIETSVKESVKTLSSKCTTLTKELKLANGRTARIETRLARIEGKLGINSPIEEDPIEEKDA